uniref:Uncharacterized protein n=1 Tax=viral metagenome TaxID=1070528 RepID=A0A6C0KQ20_9ZZZZ
MSLATFKKKSINKYSSATKISGIPTNNYWIYQGPYGIKESLASTIFLKSLVGPNGVTGVPFIASNAGFSLNGVHRGIVPIQRNFRFSKSATPFRGIYPKGWGGTRGRYPQGPDNYSLNINPVTSTVAADPSWVNPSVLSTKGMLARRFRWINSGQYPNSWVQPVYTGNQTDSASQGLYIQNKSAANDCSYDVNNVEQYVDYFKVGGPTGCQKTPARGYTIGIQQSIAPYTKTIHIPKDSSAYTLRIQRKCQDPVGLQKPFPYRVQTGTGVQTGGINVSSVASSCNTNPTFTVPPDWYTEAKIKEDGTTTTLDDQLREKLVKIPIVVQQQVYNSVFLNGTTQ